MSYTKEQIKSDLYIMELPDDATMHEVNEALRNLKYLYTHSTIATVPIDSEFSPEEKHAVVELVEKAHRRLIDHMSEGGEHASLFEHSEEDAEDLHIGNFNGQALKIHRVKKGLTLEDIAKTTRVASQHLRNIESDNYARLPESVFVKGYLMLYAKCLGLDGQRVVEDYMASISLWSQDRK